MSLQILSIALRLIAIIAFLVGVYQLSDEFYYIYSYMEREMPFIVSHFLVILIPFVMAILLWFFSTTFARFILPNTKEGKKLSDLSIEEIQSSAFSIIGLLFLLLTLDKAFTVSILLYRLHQQGNVEGSVIGSAVIGAINIIIGMWLIFGSSGLVGLIKKARYAGIEK